MKNYAVALLVLMATAFSASALADFGGGTGNRFADPEMMVERMTDHLDLDDAQRPDVRNILEAARLEAEALREQMVTNKEALKSLDVSDPAYSTELNNIALSNGQLATEGTLLVTRVRTEISAVLTDEQRDKLERKMERKREAFERRLQRR